jgi:hypothetical protein
MGLAIRSTGGRNRQTAACATLLINSASALFMGFVNMVSALSIRIVYFDADVYELKVTASNGRFSGSVNLYISIGQLEKLADDLTGFPQNSADKRDIELGTFERGFAGGGVKIRLLCTDGAGHVQMQLRMETDHNEDDPAQTVSLLLPIEPASIDTFVDGLRELEKNRAGEASLGSYN